ncbi:hypothetical protein ALP22_200222 [Pseudomonas coronafaciens pv. porri]|nr:hypothetical protein ALP22_200222 [Pseudomonas coronafaciens pv. porri]
MKLLVGVKQTSVALRKGSVMQLMQICYIPTKTLIKTNEYGAITASPSSPSSAQRRSAGTAQPLIHQCLLGFLFSRCSSILIFHTAIFGHFYLSFQSSGCHVPTHIRNVPTQKWARSTYASTRAAIACRAQVSINRDGRRVYQETRTFDRKQVAQAWMKRRDA